MSDAESNDRPNGERPRPTSIIRHRPRVSTELSVVVALVFAILATPIVMADQWVPALAGLEMTEGEPSPISVRIPQFSGHQDTTTPIGLEKGSLVVARGDEVTAADLALAESIRQDQPSGLLAWLAYLGGLFFLALLYTTQLRRSHKGRLLRTQTVTLALVLGIAAILKLVLMLSAVSVLLVPVAGAALLAAAVVDLAVGLATGLVAAVLVGFLVPFDLGTLTILAVQALVAVLVLGEGNSKKKRRFIIAGLLGGLAAAVAYAIFYSLATGSPPTNELASPLDSAWLAAGAGGILSGLVALPSKSLYQFLLEGITHNKLVELEDLSNPLLKQIAEKAPGTWQHSLAMANMAEVAANSIGADGRLVRVGAYYHDLGKSLQSSYFIENLRKGESSPHDRLAPEVSSDAIFSHVTEGVRVGRKHGLPERVIDFMHMHHGDGLLEYFWAKCQEQGNPKKLTPDDFRYPGIQPQSRETAILAICDAVEAASRTLKNPDEHAISGVVQRIVYGKLHLGQLDESGLSVADLRKVSNSLMETITHAFHGRIEYPWQKRERAESEEATTSPERPRAAEEPQRPAAESGPISNTQRIIQEPRLDSLDAPRPYWRGRASPRLETAPTERVGSNQSASDLRATTEADPAMAPTAQQASPTSAEEETILLHKRSNGSSPDATAQVGAAAADSSPAMPAADSSPAMPAADSSPAMPAADATGPAASSSASLPAGAGQASAEPAAPVAVADSVAAQTPAPAEQPQAQAPPERAPTPAPVPAAEQPQAQVPPERAPTPAPVPAEQPQAPAAPMDAPSAQEPASPAAVAELSAEGHNRPPPRNTVIGVEAATPARPAAVVIETKSERVVDPEPPRHSPRPSTEQKLVEWNDALESATPPPEEAAEQPAEPAAAEQPAATAVTEQPAAPAAVEQSAEPLPEEERDAAAAAPAAESAPDERRKPPPPPGGRRGGRTTIPLMQIDEAKAEGKAKGEYEPARAARAQTEDDELGPGVMVLGPPPATHAAPKRSRASRRANDDDE